MPITRTVDPTSDPVPLPEILDHCGITDPEDNDRVAHLVKAATRHAETISRKQLITQTWRERFDSFSGAIITLRRRPLQTVTHVKYYDSAGNQQTVSNTDYDVDTDSDPGQIVLGYNKTWPVCRGHTNDVEILYVCGYGDDSSDVPDTFHQAIKMMIGDWNENRERNISGTIIAEVPGGAMALLLAERDYRFG